jgi:hypothetical protein
MNNALPRMLILTAAALMLSLCCMPASSCTCEGQNPPISIDAMYGTYAIVDHPRTMTAAVTDMDYDYYQNCTLQSDEANLSYSWSSDGSPTTGTSSSYTVTWSTPGTKSVTLVVSNTGGCIQPDYPPAQRTCYVEVYNRLTQEITCLEDDPTSSSVINFSVVYSETPAYSLNPGSITLGGTAGATTKVVTGSGATWNVAVSGMTQDGTVSISIGAATNCVYHGTNCVYNEPSSAEVEYDRPPRVTIDKASGQDDPAGIGTINYTVVFDESVTGFTDEDVTFGGSAGPTTAKVTSNDGTTYNVAVTGMTDSGDVTASISAGVAVNANGFPNDASTSTDNTVAYTDMGIIWRTFGYWSASGLPTYYAPQIAMNSLDQILAIGPETYGAIGGDAYWRRKYSSEDGSLICSYNDISDDAILAKTPFSQNFYTTSYCTGDGKWGAQSIISSTYYSTPPAGISGSADGIAVDQQGKVYVTWRYVDHEYLSIYSSDYSQLYDSFDLQLPNDDFHWSCVADIAVDQSGGVYIAYWTQYLDQSYTAVDVKTFVKKYWKEQGNWTHWNCSSTCGYASGILEGNNLTYSDGSGPVLVSASGDIYIACSHWIFGLPYTQHTAITKIDGQTGAVIDNGIFDVGNALGGIFDIALYDNQGTEELYVVGTAADGDSIPITNDAYQSTNSGYNGFIAKLDADTLDAIYCSYFGQAQSQVSSIALDSSGDVYIGFGTNETATFPGWSDGGYICKVKIPD